MTISVLLVQDARQVVLGMYSTWLPRQFKRLLQKYAFSLLIWTSHCPEVTADPNPPLHVFPANPCHDRKSRTHFVRNIRPNLEVGG